MTDAELVTAFERGTLSPDDFGHANHVRLAWLYLCRYPLPAVLDRLTRGLDQLTRRLGVPHRYHETITYAYVFLINERLARTGRDRPDASRGSSAGLAAEPDAGAEGESGPSWHEFAAANPDLLAHGKAALLPYYRHGELDTDLARKTFVLPGPG